MNTKRVVTVSGISGLGFLLVGAVMPDLLHASPAWVSLAILGTGIACLAFALTWSFIGDYPRSIAFVGRHTHHRNLQPQTASEASMQRVGEKAPERDATLHEGLCFAIHGDWNRPNVGDGELSDFGKALERFHQLAADNILTTWGKPNNLQMTNVYQEIGSVFWKSSHVDLLDAVRDLSCARSSLVPAFESFQEIMVSKEQFESMWSNRPTCAASH